LLQRVAKAARAKQFFQVDNHLLVCVSGGPDSVALLSLLSGLAPSWNLRLSVVHVNHVLRGAESDEDARFVASLCAEMSLPCFCEVADLRHDASGLMNAVGRRRVSSIQGQARALRYAAILRVGRSLGVDRIALGHTADDQAETVLMWMLRGAGTTGLAGIPEAREGMWIRPLLEVSRAEILDHLKERGLPFRMDSSNAKPVYLRNRIRNQLLPVLRDFNPALLKVLTRQSLILREEDRCLEQLASEAMGRWSRQMPGGHIALDREGLLALPLALQRRVVRAVMREMAGAVQGPPFRAVDAVLGRIVLGQSGSGMTVAGTEISREYGRIRFQASRRVLAAITQQDCAKGDANTPTLTEVPATLPWLVTGQVIRVTPGDGPAGDTSTAEPRRATRAVFDADRISLPLRLRSWRPGDSFQPLGMQGRRKKLQDYFSDQKVPREERGRVPLLIAPQGILWVVGYRADHRFAATTASRRTLIAELVGEASLKGIA
jgi:tRNA(Ile)-lysidine synthase